MRLHRARLVVTLGFAGFLGFLLWATAGFMHSAFAGSVLQVPRDFSTIQAAVDAASSGDIVQVAPGTYAENLLVMTQDISLHGVDATLDGTGLGGNGIHVLDTNGVVIIGFVVENFENGIVLQNVDDSKVHLNELRNNVSPQDVGPMTRNGILLDNAHGNLLTNNHTHDNGHNGMTLLGASSNNTFIVNRSVNNGTDVAEFLGGCGLQTFGPNNDNNVIVANEFLGGDVQGWGILIGGDGVSSGNFIAQNRSHGQHRAGIAMNAPASGNFIQQNNATGNGLANMPPSGNFDLWDEDGAATDNTWKRNQGTSNF